MGKILSAVLFILPLVAKRKIKAVHCRHLKSTVYYSLDMEHVA